jgi:membrane associated rhomboid family serine protease
MGFEDRDYYRAESGGTFFTGAGSAVKALIAINAAVFLLQVVTIGPVPNDPGSSAPAIDQWLNLQPDLVAHGQIWRILTYGFGFSGNLIVFLFDLYFLWIFGKTIEEMYGTRELILYYLAAVLLGGAVGTLAALGPNHDAVMMGSAVPILAVTVLFAWHYPRMQILLFFLIPVEIWIVVALIAASNLFSAAQFGLTGGLFVAELVVIGFALLYGWGGRRIEDLIPAQRPRIRMPRRKPKLRVFEPEQKVNLDQQVDEILAKIHEQGEASLTDRERKTLQEASRRYKKT